MIDLACYDEQGNVLNELYQWDVGRKIEVRGLDVRTGYVVRFNFTNDRFDVVYSVQAEKTGDNYTGVIPNEIVRDSRTIMMYAYLISESGERLTAGAKRIWVNPRQKPETYEYTPTTSIVEVATGLVINNGMIYLARDGIRFGDGVMLGGGIGKHEDVAVVVTVIPEFSRPEIIEITEVV